MDFSAISEEIALEGLDGITLNALWKRLEDRPDFVNGQVDEDCKQYFWKCICSVIDFNFYILLEPRQELVIFKYSDYISLEGGKCHLNEKTLPDIYSHKLIDQDGVMGSCDHYESRKKVTDEVRSSDGSSYLSLNDVTERWGERFVIVASQQKRNLVLLGSTVCPPGLWSDIYAILEAVGRARYDGEITQCKFARGLYNPFFFKFCNAANVFARVKLLVKLGYATKQPFTLRYESPACITQVRLVHLRRFYNPTKANHKGCFQVVSDYLLKQPKHSSLFTDVIKNLYLAAGLFKKRRKMFYEYFSLKTVNYSEYFPDDKDCKTKNGNEKKVRVLSLIKPYNDDNIDDEDDDDEDENDDIDDNEESHKTEAIVLDDGAKDQEKQKSAPIYGYLSYHRSFLSQVMQQVIKSGEKGVHQSELMNRLHLGKCMTRCVIKDLRKNKKIATIGRAVSRQNANYFVTPEVAERLKKTKTVETIKVEPVDDVDDDEDNTVNAVDDTSLLEETSLYPSESTNVQEPENDVNYLEFEVNKFEFSCFLEKSNSVIKTVAKKEENDKKKARKAFILRELAETKVFSSARSILLKLRAEEKLQGLKEHMCHKSLKRILNELFCEGHFFYVNVFEKLKPDKRILQIIADCSTKLEVGWLTEVFLTSSYNFIKLDAPSTDNQAPPAISGETSLAASSSKPSSNKPPHSAMISVCKMLDKRESSASDEKRVFSPSYRSLYGKVPKFERAKMLHKYLFYRHYGYEGYQDVTITESVHEGSLPVYLDVGDWRRYLPPLIKHNESLLSTPMIQGSCMIGDLLLHMPLSIFCSIVNITWQVDGLNQLLEHPDKKNYPLNAVPQSVLKKLLHRRNYLFRLNEALQMLCYLGLLTYGTKTSSRKLEFTTFYVHKKATILDTRKSIPAYSLTSCPEGETFEPLHYNFQSMKDVDNYWNDVKVISLNSKLGSYSVDDVQGNYGTVSLVEGSMPVAWEAVNEDNWLPGDHRGAAGFDSSLFVHRYSSWVKKGNKSKKNYSVMVMSSKVVKSEGASVFENKRVANKKKEHKNPPAKKKKVSRPERSEDAVDKQARLNRKKQRSYFTPLENGMLLLSQVASCILSPKTNICVKASVIRDILQELLPEARDKTSASVKGKMSRLMKDEKFRNHLVSYIAHAHSDKKLMENYQEKKFAILSPGIEKQFRVLHRDLRSKFSQTRLPEALSLPKTIGELLEQYDVKSTMDILYKKPKMSKVISCVDDIKEIVVYELLESFLHVTKPLSGRDVYHTLSTFPEHVIDRAYNSLKCCSVIVLMKKFEKDSIQIIDRPDIQHSVNRNALLNNHKSTLRHRDAMKTQYPADLFSNLLKQIDALRKTPSSEQLKPSLHGIVQHKSTLKKGRASQIDRSMHNEFNADSGEPIEIKAGTANIGTQLRGHDVVEMDSSLPQGNGFSAQLDISKGADFKELNWKDYHGGSVLALISFLAMDLLKMKLIIPDEMVKLDEEGRKQLNFKHPKDLHRKRKLDTSIDSDEDSNDAWPVSGKAGPTFQHQRSGKKVPSRGAKCPKLSSNDQDDNDLPASDSTDKGSEKCLTFKDVTLKMRCLKNSASGVLENFTVWVASGSLLTIARTSLIESLDLLNSKCLKQRNFFVEPLDMRFALKENIFPMPWKKAFITPQSQSSNTYCTQTEGTTQSVKLVNQDLYASQVEMTKAIPPRTVIQETVIVPQQLVTPGTVPQKFVTPVSVPQEIVTPVSVPQQLFTPVTVPQQLVTHVSVPQEIVTPVTEKQEPVTFHTENQEFLTSEAVTPEPNTNDPSLASVSTNHYHSHRKDSHRSLFCEELYKDVISRMKKHFSPDMINDEMWPLLESILPKEFLKDGHRLFKLIDSYRELGITESELEKKMECTLYNLKPVLTFLIRADAVFKVGLSQRAYVSRPHVKVWFVEVPLANYHLRKSHDNDNTDELFVENSHNESRKLIIYQCRYWRNFNGSLNCQALETVLKRVVTYLMAHPGCSLIRLCHVLNPDLLPITTIDAVDILEEIGCVELLRIQKPGTCSMFSTRRCPVVGDHLSLEESVTTVNVAIDAPVKLAFFLNFVALHCHSS